MRWLAALPVLWAAILSVSADDWTTVDGTTYKNVTVVQVSDDGLTITSEGTTVKIPYYNLPLDIQKQYGHDPDSAESKQKEADDAEAARKAAALIAQQQADKAKQQQSDESAQIQALDAARAAHHSSSSGASPGIPDSAGDRTTYPGAEYGYNKFQNVCYLDSPAVNVVPLAAGSDGGHTSLILRVGTFGSQPQQADKILVTIRSIGTIWKLTDNHDILFLVDGASVPVDPDELRDSDFLAGFGQVVESVSFFMPPEQVQAIVNGKDVKFYIGGSYFSLDPAGLPALGKYMTAVGQLPAPSSAFSQKYTQFTNNLPSIPNMISKTCEYIILGSCSILIFIGFVVCCIGAARFIRW